MFRECWKKGTISPYNTHYNVFHLWLFHLYIFTHTQTQTRVYRYILFAAKARITEVKKYFPLHSNKSIEFSLDRCVCWFFTGRRENVFFSLFFSSLRGPTKDGSYWENVRKKTSMPSLNENVFGIYLLCNIIWGWPRHWFFFSTKLHDLSFWNKREINPRTQVSLNKCYLRRK